MNVDIFGNKSVFFFYFINRKISEKRLKRMERLHKMRVL